jgi:hypothetical protein
MQTWTEFSAGRELSPELYYSYLSACGYPTPRNRSYIVNRAPSVDISRPIARRAPMSAAQRWLTSFHESGHGIGLLRYKVPLYKLAVEPADEPGMNGYAEHDRAAFDALPLLDRVVIALCGPLAAAKYGGYDQHSAQWRGDIADLEGWTGPIDGVTVGEGAHIAGRLVDREWGNITAPARALFANGELPIADIQQLLDDAAFQQAVAHTYIR